MHTKKLGSRPVSAFSGITAANGDTHSVFFRKTQKRFEESGHGCQRPIAPSRPGKQVTARPRSATIAPQTLEQNITGPSPQRPQPPFPRPHHLPGETWRSRGPHVWDGEGSGSLALRLSLSPLASRAPKQPSPPSLGSPSPSRDVFHTRPLTPDPSSPQCLPELVLQAS